MLLATILLLGAIPQSGQVARAVANAPAEAIAEASNEAAGERSLPSMPVAKSKFDAAGDGVSASITPSAAGAEAVQPPRVALSMQPVKAAYMRPREIRNQRTLYAVTQVSPAVMDLIGKRMMVSQNRWVRRLWWLPQAAGSGFSIGAGVHNMGVVR